VAARTEIPTNEIDRQKAIIQSIQKSLEMRSDPPLAYIDTYGCQQNESDSEKIRGMLSEMGYGFTSDEFQADVIVINTCAIRENAENRVFGNIGALVHTKKAKPSQVIIFCGCMAAMPETVEKVKNSYKHVDLMFAPNVIWKFPELLHKTLNEKGRIFETVSQDSSIAEGLPAHRDGTVKAWLSIMYGCNNYCSYCIVPYVRGRERSRESVLIIDEAKQLIAEGYKDITLLGQNVNSYGLGLEEEINFAQLIRKLNELEGDFLIRFMTSHPKDASNELFEAMAQCDKVAKHIHLPFQAGNNRILELMNRGYTHEQYLEKIKYARSLMPDIVLTSDVIVGFPGETEEEFEDTLKLVEQAQFDAQFTFLYSKRPGTPAAQMEDTTSREIKQERFDRLLDLQNAISDKKHNEYVGKTYKVLIDGQSDDERYPLNARTNGGRLVHFSGDTNLIGSFVQAKITHCNSWSLFGELSE